MGLLVLNTRPKNTDCELAKALTLAGCEVVSLPMIELRATNRELLTNSLEQLGAGDLALFTSGNGIKFLREAVGDELFKERFLKVGVGVIGKKTASQFVEPGISPDFISKTATGEAFAEELLQWLAERNFPKNKAKIVFYKAQAAGDVLESKLYRAGYSIEAVVTYYSVLPEHSVEESKSLATFLDAECDKVMTFTSSECVRNFLKVAEKLSITRDERQRLEMIPVAVIGPKTKESAEKCGFSTILCSPQADLRSLAQLVGRLGSYPS